MRQLVAALACLLALSAEGAPKAFASEDELAQWVTFYYTRPEPSRVAEAMTSASKMGLFREGKAAPPFFGFLAGVLGKDPSLAPSIVKQLSKLPVNDQPVVVLGVWYSGHKDTRQFLAELTKSMPALETMVANLTGSTAPRLTDISLEEGPWVLDALWGTFMATGEDAPVIRIMSALPWIEVRGNIPKLMVGGAAKWSLTSNAVQHGRVLEMCREQIRHQSKEVAAVLAQIIAQAEEDLRKQGASGSNSSLDRTK